MPIFRKKRPEIESSLGYILKRMGVVSPEELNRAIADQTNTGDELGAILLDQGIVGVDELEMALNIQAQMRSGNAALAMTRVVDYLTEKKARSVERMSFQTQAWAAKAS
jgi:hypothetical protein